MYLSLYRRYRPSCFSEIVGQEGVVEALLRSLQEGRASHAYLFSGPRGCGKTSAARLVAKRLNCASPAPGGESCGQCPSCLALAAGEHMDVVEIDGASNRGIEEIRELKSHVSLAPFQSPHKVYIIDEVHMLTEPAFNALLKTLEEPPSRVYFILATTEPQKVPVTIRSRCVHLPFQRIPNDDVVARLHEVCRAEGVEAEPQALWEIARQSDGALRDALSLLEQVLALQPEAVTVAALRRLLGGTGREDLERWLQAFRQEPGQAFPHLSRLAQRGANLERLLEGFYLLFRDLLFFRIWGEAILPGLGVSPEEAEYLRQEALQWSESSLERGAALCASLFPRARQGLRADVFSGLLFQRLGEARRLPEGAPRGGPIVPEPTEPSGGENAPSPPPVSRPLPPFRQEPCGERGSGTAGVAPSPPVFPLPVEESSCPVPRVREEDEEKAGLGEVEEEQRVSDPSGWNPLVLYLAQRDLPLAAGILRSRIVREGESLALVVPEEDRILSQTLRSPKSRRILREGAQSLFGGELRLAGEEAPPSSPPEREGAPGSPEGDSFTPPDSVVSRVEGLGREFQAPPGGEPAEKGEWIHEAISWLDAEVLFIQKGTREEESGTGDEGVGE